MIASKGDPQMSRRGGKTHGWAAFDQQQRQKGLHDSRLTNEPFPSLTSTMTSFEKAERVSGNKNLLPKPFSSIVVAPTNVVATIQDNKKSKQSEGGSSGGFPSQEISTGGSFGGVLRQLKEQYSWADDTLIEDIMASVGNDFGTVSSFLKAMLSDDRLEDDKETTLVKCSCESVEIVSNGRALYGGNDILTEKVSEFAKACYTPEACLDHGYGIGTNDSAVRAEKLSDDCIEINAMLGQLTCVPVEPEWEEDDVYLSSRKDAIKTMRAAARHSKAATNSFLRGDHFSAQQFSLKAQEEWEIANRLNAKAAREILSVRNTSNGIWRLDLHGLHVVEAVQALRQHLHKIETQLYSKGSNPSCLLNGNTTKAEATSSSSECYNLEKSDEQAFSRPNSKWLEVITGIGNHSRGGAALPTAVRTFLVDNGYRIDEARLGVIMVRPKFRF